jgi:hypothetical protein
MPSCLTRGIFPYERRAIGVHSHGYFAPMEDWSLDIRRYVTDRIGAHVPEDAG